MNDDRETRRDSDIRSKANWALIGFIVIMLGFLLQWPTLVTLIMFPVLVVTYVVLARSEERDALANFGEEYRQYMARTPAFIPRITLGNSSARSPRGVRPIE
jgi:steroid 5-alpha reductase family enzyme